MLVTGLISGLVILPTLFHFLQPRVPLYQFSVNKLPWFRFRTTHTNLDAFHLQTVLHANVVMQNDNYVTTAVHALAFDLYFPDWDGTLHNIGHVVDQNQWISALEEEDSKNEAVWKNETVTSLKSYAKPMWIMNARQAFETTDQVHLTLWLRKLWYTLTHLTWQTIRRGGTLSMPSTGVIHVKAAHASKLTVSMICDNHLNTWTMQMDGRKCAMHKLSTGWVDIQEEAERMRNYVTSTRTGEVLLQHEDEETKQDVPNAKMLLA